jgi:hypothetical protein
MPDEQQFVILKAYPTNPQPQPFSKGTHNIFMEMIHFME